jgi:hypothetical protein
MCIDIANPNPIELLSLDEHQNLVITSEGSLGQVAERSKHSISLSKAAKGNFTRDKRMR